MSDDPYVINRYRQLANSFDKTVIDTNPPLRVSSLTLRGVAKLVSNANPSLNIITPIAETRLVEDVTCDLQKLSVDKADFTTQAVNANIIFNFRSENDITTQDEGSDLIQEDTSSPTII